MSSKRMIMPRIEGMNCDNKNHIILTNSKNRWSDVEDKQLINNIIKFGVNENRIVENLNRTFEACRMRWYTKHNKNIEPKIHIIKKVKKQDDIYYNCLASSWTNDEENKLFQAIKLYGTKDWNKISKYINTGRSASGCSNKWGKLKYRDNSNHMQSRYLNRNEKHRRSTSNDNQHKFIDFSNITIAFADNSSPATTPTATTRSSNSLETNQRNNTNNVIIYNNNKKKKKKNNNNTNCSSNTTKNINSNNNNSNIPVASVVGTKENDNRDSITTIYDFLYRMEKITHDKWTMNDVNQLMIIMSKIKPEKGTEYMREERNWDDVGEKMVKNSDDCRVVWELIQKLSHNVVGDIMVNYWRTIN